MMIRKKAVLGALVLLLGVSTPSFAKQNHAIKVGFGLTEGPTVGYEYLLAKKHGLHVSYGGISGLSFTNGLSKQKVDFGGLGLGYRYYFSGKKEFGGFYTGLGLLFKSLTITETLAGIETGEAEADITIPYAELGYRLKFKSVLIGLYAGFGSAEADFKFTGGLTDDELEFGKSAGWALIGLDIGFAF
ncbi:hypothetical protein DID77_04740 [Candidatus Marinamargulisbacteria bacterium SCGC AG-439-L15]|nr:hypothetical protein DID77_04740 [Candidatus Marinamargulisbacteria bacterium SCGC AG-439-L15]